jgi:hypothetical protein
MRLAVTGDLANPSAPQDIGPGLQKLREGKRRWPVAFCEKCPSAKKSFTTALRAQTSYRHGDNC